MPSLVVRRCQYKAFIISTNIRSVVLFCRFMNSLTFINYLIWPLYSFSSRWLHWNLSSSSYPATIMVLHHNKTQHRSNRKLFFMTCIVVRLLCFMWRSGSVTVWQRTKYRKDQYKMTRHGGLDFNEMWRYWPELKVYEIGLQTLPKYYRFLQMLLTLIPCCYMNSVHDHQRYRWWNSVYSLEILTDEKTKIHCMNWNYFLDWLVI